MDALQLQTVIARLQGDKAAVQAALGTLLSLDPLNHFGRFERCLADSSKGMSPFTSLIRDELPQETYLELGVWYAGCGRTQEAIRVLSLAPPVAEVRLWLGWLRHQRVDGVDAVGADRLNPVGAFPFRPETGQLLEDLLRTESHWVLRYFLALIYQDCNRPAEARSLLKACGDQPDFAPFYAVRAALSLAEDSASALRDLRRASALDPQWRYRKLLADYLLDHRDTAGAEAIAGDYYHAHPDNYIIGMLYAKTLLFDRRYAESDKVLSRLTIIPFEGATAGRELYREDKLMEAVSCMKKRRYTEALEYIAAAKKWPENLGVGEPYPQDQDLRWEEWMSAYCQAALKKGAKPPIPGSLRETAGAGVGGRILRAVEEGGME